MREPREHEVRAIRQYVEIQGPGDPIELVQLLHERKVLGQMREVWDVHTTSDRWWVITNPTNLYSQSDFPSYEMALTYHIGVGVILAERSRRRAPDEDDDSRLLLGPSWRRFEQAVDSYNAAYEAEDFQAVGIHCRETLLSAARLLNSEPWVDRGDDPPPKEGDFKGWNRIYARSLTAGRQFVYVRDLGERTWDLVVALQHRSGATTWDAELCLDATGHYLHILGLLVLTLERDPEVCPYCGSYRVGTDVRWVDDEIMEVCQKCGSCEREWDIEREHVRPEDRKRDEREIDTAADE